MRSLDLEARPVADFYGAVMARLDDLGVTTTICGQQEVRRVAASRVAGLTLLLGSPAPTCPAALMVQLDGNSVLQIVLWTNALPWQQ